MTHYFLTAVLPGLLWFRLAIPVFYFEVSPLVLCFLPSFPSIIVCSTLIISLLTCPSLCLCLFKTQKRFVFGSSVLLILVNPMSQENRLWR